MCIFIVRGLVYSFTQCSYNDVVILNVVRLLYSYIGACTRLCGDRSGGGGGGGFRSHARLGLAAAEFFSGPVAAVARAEDDLSAPPE